MNAKLKCLVDEIAVIAARHASSVDQDARFPTEAIAALKAAGLLGLRVLDSGPSGESPLRVASSVCYALGRACGSSGLIYAMHMSQMACLVVAARSSTWHAAYLAEACGQQLLLASVTSEVGVGGDIQSSVCSLDPADTGFDLVKEAPTASYAVQADALLITARRSAASSSSDQVLVVAPRGTFEVDEVRRWDTLGMRGTCSGGYQLRARGHLDQVCPGSFSDLAEQAMVPVSHVLWGSVWLGIAAASVDRARSLLASKARGAMADQVAIQANRPMLRLERAGAELRTMSARLTSAIAAIEEHHIDHDPSRSMTLAMRADINGLKVTLSDMAVGIVSECLRICGTDGYRNDGAYSIGRHFRDILSAPLMINNDRIAANNAHLTLIQKTLSSVM